MGAGEAGTYTRKPTEVRAIQWTGKNVAAVRAFVGRMQNMDGDVDVPRFFEPYALVADLDHEYLFNPPERARLWVEANTTWLPLVVGEWILADAVKGAGYFYPCADDVFQATHDEKEDLIEAREYKGAYPANQFAVGDQVREHWRVSAAEGPSTVVSIFKKNSRSRWYVEVKRPRDYRGTGTTVALASDFVKVGPR